MDSRTASRTRHWRSFPSSLTKGRSDCESTSRPTTEDKSPSVPISFNRTSALSSLVKVKKVLTRWSIVSAAPKIGARLNTEPAREVRTWYDCSRGRVSFSIDGINSSMKSLLGFIAATAGSLEAATVRTSTSRSDKRRKYVGITSDFAQASNTSQSCFTLSATIYLTLHDLSSAQAFTTCRICNCQSGVLFSRPKAIQFLIARIRTESCSSLASFSKTWTSSGSIASLRVTSAISPRTFAACRRTMGVSSPQSLI
mmetsp:Transcript_8063/g.12843  ORF Transcript_8063/g.12843 Transcript_8063/m.12843 type:complete len:255 (+) Transcript_8063:258-1022(+)